MHRDELEYSISQYHDGTLLPLERNVVDELLATSEDARAVLAEFRHLDSALKLTPGMPTLNWDALQQRLSQSLADQETPIRHYRIGTQWTRWVGAGIAVAASVLIVFSVTLRNHAGSGSPGQLARHLEITVSPPGGLASANDSVHVGTGTNHEQSHASLLPTVAINVGPSANVTVGGFAYDDAFLTRPSRIVIAVDPQPMQDASGPAPF